MIKVKASDMCLPKKSVACTRVRKNRRSARLRLVPSLFRRVTLTSY